MLPKSGYKTITGLELLNGLYLLQQRKISFRAFRVYLACFSIVAIREAARRTRAKNKRQDPVTPAYRIAELARAVGAQKGEVAFDLRVLRKAGILFFDVGEISSLKHGVPGVEILASRVRSPLRPIPVPRATLRFLEQARKKSVALTALAYMLRGLTIDARSGEVKGRGSAKLSWVAAIAGISERAAAYARRELIRIGWVAADSGSTQRKLNRDGAYFQIDLNFQPPPTPGIGVTRAAGTERI